MSETRFYLAFRPPGQSNWVRTETMREGEARHLAGILVLHEIDSKLVEVRLSETNIGVVETVNEVDSWTAYGEKRS